MFGNKNKANTKTEEKKVNDSNIFEDFSSSADLKKDVKDFEKQKSKDVFFYISKVSSFFSYINIFVFLVLIVLFSYVYVQNNDEISDSTWLDPFCSFILGDIPLPNGSTYCSSISFVKKSYNQTLTKTKSEIYDETSNLVDVLFQKQSSLNSKDLLFLLNRSSSRMKPFEIINDFDKLKNSFELEYQKPYMIYQKGDDNISYDPKEFLNDLKLKRENGGIGYLPDLKVICDQMDIKEDYKLTVKCEVITYGWEENILGFSGKRNYVSIKGDETYPKKDKDSISGGINTVLSSFVNYIELNSDKFSIEDISYGYDLSSISENSSGIKEVKATVSFSLSYDQVFDSENKL